MKHFFRRVSRCSVWILMLIIAACSQPQYHGVPSKSTDIAAYNPKDYPKAYAYFKQKAAQGDPVAMDNLGHMYEDGRGVTQDQAQAVYWFTKAAKAGNSDAQLNLGVAYLYGNGVPQNKIIACQWFKKAQKAQHPYGGKFYSDNC
jgi:TPR repeat protein